MVDGILTVFTEPSTIPSTETVLSSDKPYLKLSTVIIGLWPFIIKIPSEQTIISNPELKLSVPILILSHSLFEPKYLIFFISQLLNASSSI